MVPIPINKKSCILFLFTIFTWTRRFWNWSSFIYRHLFLPLSGNNKEMHLCILLYLTPSHFIPPSPPINLRACKGVMFPSFQTQFSACSNLKPPSTRRAWQAHFHTLTEMFLHLVIISTTVSRAREKEHACLCPCELNISIDLSGVSPAGKQIVARDPCHTFKDKD